MEICEDVSEGEDFKLKLTRRRNRQIINAKFQCEYYKTLEKEFEQLVTEDKIFQSKRKYTAMMVLQQR